MLQLTPRGSGFRILAVYATVCAVILVLQWIPVIGLTLMFLFAPIWFLFPFYWLGIVVHLAMLHLTVGALVHWIARAWVLVPATFYTSGVALHLVAVLQVNQQIAAIQRMNAAVTIKADEPFTFTADGQPSPLYLLMHYRTDRMLESAGDRNDGSVRISYYARGDTCGYRDLFPAYRGVDKAHQCILSQKGPPITTRYRVKGEYTTASNVLVQRFGTKWTVFDGRSGDRLLAVEAAEFNVILSVLMPRVGCGLDDAGPKAWGCFAEIIKSRSYIRVGYQSDNGTQANGPEIASLSILARALSLDPRQPTDN
jgi:hypothetical protein